MTDHSKEEKTIPIAIIAIVAALALLGVVVITALTIPLQRAEAKGVCGTSGLFPSAIHSGNRSLTSCIPR
ncbi:MAG TPA: hypothetical protein VFG77_08480 [Nitrososphaeraceae archaeon]|nr:hypothetical protein [Nitrososphaeraceae archaeon]